MNPTWYSLSFILKLLLLLLLRQQKIGMWILRLPIENFMFDFNFVNASVNVKFSLVKSHIKFASFST